MSKKKKQEGFKVEFAPGCFDQFEGTQEELDELISSIKETLGKATPEDLERMSQPLDETWDELSEEDQESILRNLDNLEASKKGKKRTLN